ncbi:hypothetical protein PVAP13_8NG340830 [Panicum virgatum]|uniref:Defensin n=1 Tax=Panicum virgatum TaxID=38727 RepID=A0A8T0PKL5_PANVG|nr:hypothetical protein PVAP13_8NG340830 [Panicum virgatum]
MARKAIVAAAASVIALILSSFLLPSGVEAGLQTGGCKLTTCNLCKPRCQYEGNDGGFCDARKNCICVDCSKHGDGPSRLVHEHERRHR